MEKLIIKKNPNGLVYNEVSEAVKRNDGYCPCMIDKNEDTKCPCLEFRTQTCGYCRCERYYKDVR